MDVLDYLRALLSRRDWVYLLSLLVPLIVYNLALKAASVVSRPGEHEFAQVLDLMWSDVFFNLGYALLWLGLFAAARRGPLRRVVVFLFHVVTMLVVIVNTCAYQYFKENGTTLDYGTTAGISNFDEMQQILTQRVPFLAWMLLFVALFYASLGPWLLAHAVERWRGWPRISPAATAETPFFGSLRLQSLSLGLWLLVIGFGSLSLLTGTTTLARDPFVNMVLTGVKEATAEEDVPDADSAAEHPAANASLVETPQTEKRNVVLIHLESTRAQSVTPYNEDLETTPFLDELAKSSLLAERAYVGSVPRSTLANIAVNCGIEPPPRKRVESEIPAQCLAGLLKEQGYRSVFFDSNTTWWGELATLYFGYEEVFVPPDPEVPAEYRDETIDTSRFAETSYFGYEEDIMLEPSRRWLENNRDKPFMAEYVTGTGHDDYRCLSTGYGTEDFSEDELLNRYLNCLRLQDIFLKNLFDQYKELGLYEDTIFVLFGDHGEGFGEHGRFLHNDTIYEEGLKVPLIIHDPKRFEDGERVEGLSSQIDILPTVLEMLGYEVKNGDYPGHSLLHPLPGGRTLFFSCISKRECLASIKGYEKYIHYYGDQPDEVFDLSKDPLEKQNLADERDKQELDERREDLVAWLSKVNAEYGGG